MDTPLPKAGARDSSEEEEGRLSGAKLLLSPPSATTALNVGEKVNNLCRHRIGGRRRGRERERERERQRPAGEYVRLSAAVLRTFEARITRGVTFFIHQGKYSVGQRGLSRVERMELEYSMSNVQLSFIGGLSCWQHNAAKFQKRASLFDQCCRVLKIYGSP